MNEWVTAEDGPRRKLFLLPRERYDCRVPSTSPQYSGRQVLLVDADSEVVALLEFVLSRYGQEPISAHDARTALQLFRQRQPDVVLLDIMLGTSSTLQVLKEIRQLSAVPVIMLTAMDDTQDKVRGLQMGADDYITKPFNPQELMAEL
jgi:two-component system response regulator MtrA